CISNVGQDVQKGPSSKAAGSEEAEAYEESTLRPTSDENAAGGLFQHPVRTALVVGQVRWSINCPTVFNF
ncbi:MAG: hypothetical protein ACE1ZJ_02510, partial [Nitrospirales bacterium]